ncbi:MAG: NUDIX hydrolase [Chitinophagales bacterium]|nr:NUDIX hydrolase [Chitinophagales bacterium]
MNLPIKYCFNCGATMSFQAVVGDTHKRFVCNSCHNIHYTNPNVVVGALVHYQNKVLLCKRAIEPRKGFWNLPAGYLEDNEKVEDGATREVWEEAGANIKIIQPYVIYNLPQANQVYIHFLAELTDGIIRNGEESLASALFDEAEIPWKEMAFTSSTYTLNRFFEDRKTGNFKTHLATFPDK